MGSSLAHECIARGYDVRGLDNLCTGTIDNIADIREIEFYRGNLTDRRLLREICKDMEIIFHYAAFPSVEGLATDPLASHATNVDGTLNLLIEACRRGVRRVIFAASSAAYGCSEVQPACETMLPVPATLYATQKLANEYYMQCFARNYGVETVSLRYFNVFGPRQTAYSPHSTVIAHFITSMLSSQAPEIFGDGRQSRDFTFIDDVIEANMLAASAAPEAVNGKVFNIASGITHTLLEVYQVIAEVLRFTQEPRFLPGPAGSILHSQADISSAYKYLGCRPRIPFRIGVEQTINWYRSNRHRQFGRMAPAV